MSLYLISFRDGSYKKIRPIRWKHNQWINYELRDGSSIVVNPNNVNYIHYDIHDRKKK